ncbi:P-loop containing nucleoside triphosphate hydrolase protein [Lasiosphaeria miniovina]|uniref:P-loop containing nucleoside triphosphate hydrolase protein n=1 Tax=Lasiosphaeria miniovina TaxID=1954250 RepID=A0AA40BHZ1_9PEZI|nr:P-loop containing nucleoside triphosphate hydrolase protein [Lasiosphaeria miniovina]KAK0734582.1 P-loop containing nucleoside triphosphate hydrolase protein [Lasiosphaeria miniovina]
MAPGLGSALDAQELAGDQRELLDLIDKLQFAQLDNVKLPQIVVVGDQSAGKSSVLEAITGTPFPRDAGACTRFATEIRMRRAPENSIAVSIIPDKNRNFKEQERLRQFGGMVDINMSFDSLMRAAVELIAPKNIPGRFAARDILVVEKRGPDMPLLTLVDLPGLVRNANNDQSNDDIKTIEALSERYMKSSRTIILAVVGGNSDYVQAPILTKTRVFDPKGSRTIGVLTKPDLTETIGLEDKFIELVNNKDKRNEFRLGWYVLLNPGPRDQGQPWPDANERRQIEEDFFTHGKWSSVPESMRGARALMQKLSVQLQRHIGKHVKVLRKQIQKALDDCEAELKSLGTGKDTPQEMRTELVELFSASKELVIPAVYGLYKNPPKKAFFRVTADPRGTPAQNLRARATEENDRFAAKVRAHGRKFNFSAPDPRSPNQDPAVGAKRDFVRQEVEPLLRQIRGSEFPMDPKPRAVYMLFQSYGEYWPKFAQEHKDNLGVVCNEFLAEVIAYAWPKRMRHPLRQHFLDPQMKALMAKAQQELDLLAQDMNLEVQPYDPEYEERLRNWQALSSQDEARFSEAEEVLEKMLIYYELSAKSFIRNTITQVVERHLLQGMYGIFNSVEVLGMTDEVIEAIAAENKETRGRRQTLKLQKKAIEEAKDICASLAMRKELRVQPEDDQDDIGDSSEEDTAKVSERQRQASSPSARQPRRPARQPIEEAQAPQVAAPRVVEASRDDRDGRNGHRYVPTAAPTGDPNGHAPPRLDQSAILQHGADGRYSRPPMDAPPPPPRPDKIQTEERNSHTQAQAYAQSPARASPIGNQESSPERYYPNGYVNNTPYTPTNSRPYGPGQILDPAEYARRQSSARKAAGRA